jgi:prepilin-type processing-associated H-X9-DG protein
VAFADAALAADEVIEYSFAEPPFWPHLPEYRPDPSAHFRHEGRAMVVWLDGHISGEAMTHSESSGLYPLDPRTSLIGWSGDASSNSLFDYR